MRFAWLAFESQWLIFGIRKRLLTSYKPMVNNSRMKFKSWADGERGRAAALAVHLGVSQAFMSELVGGVKAIPIKHCQAIYAFTGGDVTLPEMRPNDWEKIWPELASAPASRAQAATETVAGGV